MTKFKNIKKEANLKLELINIYNKAISKCKKNISLENLIILHICNNYIRLDDYYYYVFTRAILDKQYLTREEIDLIYCICKFYIFNYIEGEALKNVNNIKNITDDVKTSFYFLLEELNKECEIVKYENEYCLYKKTTGQIIRLEFQEIAKQVFLKEKSKENKEDVVYVKDIKLHLVSKQSNSSGCWKLYQNNKCNLIISTDLNKNKTTAYYFNVNDDLKVDESYEITDESYDVVLKKLANKSKPNVNESKLNVSIHPKELIFENIVFKSNKKIDSKDYIITNYEYDGHKVRLETNKHNKETECVIVIAGTKNEFKLLKTSNVSDMITQIGPVIKNIVYTQQSQR